MDHRTPDHFDEVLRKVEDALDHLRLGDGPTKDALLSGVRAALEELEPDALGVELEATLSDLDPSPAVHVVDGGRDPEGPPSPGSRPDLRVADPSAADAPGSDLHEESLLSGMGFDDESPSVRVVRVTRRTEGASHHTGTVSLSSPDAWQTVFRGATPRRYRIRCDSGAIHVALDGALVEELQPGQTSDFEGTLIRVIARSSEGAEGAYWAIGDAP
jgi:hypothetical protein